MNSGKEDIQPMNGPIFKYDPETGQRIVLPMKWISLNPSSVKKSDKKVKRNLSQVPLKLTAADLEEPPIRPSKMRKMDHNSIRKELFNPPAKKAQVSRSGSSLTTRRSIATKKVHQKKVPPPGLSPLLDMEEVEEELIKKKGCLQGYHFKTPTKPSIKFTRDSKCDFLARKINLEKNSIAKIEIQMSSESVYSNESEFSELEKMCEENPENKQECEQSPVSSVCNLLEGTIINSTKKDKKKPLNNVTNLIGDIENMLLENDIAFEEYKITHDKNLSKIKEILETDKKQYDNTVALQNKNKKAILGIVRELKLTYEDSIEGTANKENSVVKNRRSVRLLNKSPVQTKDAKLIVSPAMSRNRDLRKTTLTKNLLTKSQQYNIESPRIQKALDRYNAMRSEVTFLSTPRLDRSYLTESPRSTNLTRNLSRTIQNQCLMLQDTPVHK